MTELAIEIDIPAQDYVKVANYRSPGLAVVRGCDSPRNFDVQQGYAFTGATAIFTGEGLAKFDVDFYAWEPAHFEAWRTFAKLVLAPPTRETRSRSMSFEHPLVNNPPLSITQVVVTNVTQWEQGPDGGGLYMCTVSFMQFRPRVPVDVKMAKGPPPAPAVVKPPARPAEATMKALVDEIAELGKR